MAGDDGVIDPGFDVLTPGSTTSTSSEETLSLVIEQIAGTNPKTVTLENHDAPMGAPRKGGMFELGGKNEKEVIRLVGRQTPIIHTKYTVWAPHVIKGHLRDHFTGIDGHSRQIVSDLQDILDDQQEVKITCGPWTWTAFPDEFKLPVEGLNDFTYELKFEVLSRPGQKPAPPPDNLLPYPTDLTSEIQQELVAQRQALLVQQIAADVQIALATAFTALDDSLTATASATAAFENADLPAYAESLAMAAAAENAKVACDELAAELEPLSPAAAMTVAGDDQIAAFQAQQFATLSMLDDCRARMWQVAFTANKRIRSVTKVYTVAPGDTLDSIAKEQLGSAARVSDLNLRQQDLVVGRKIRIPKS